MSKENIIVKASLYDSKIISEDSYGRKFEVDVPLVVSDWNVVDGSGLVINKEEINGVTPWSIVDNDDGSKKIVKDFVGSYFQITGSDSEVMSILSHGTNEKQIIFPNEVIMYNGSVYRANSFITNTDEDPSTSDKYDKINATSMFVSNCFKDRPYLEIPVTVDDLSSGNMIDFPSVVRVLSNDFIDNGMLDSSSVMIMNIESDVKYKTMIVQGEGTWNVNSDGSIEFIPESGFVGSPTKIRYVVYSIQNIESNISTVTVEYDIPNNSPIANSDIATTGYTEPVLIDVIANDTDADGDQLTIVSIDSGPYDGTAVISNNKILYTPSGNTFGDDYIGYTVTDGMLQSSSTITVTVEPPAESAPVANADSESNIDVLGVATINVTSNDTDADDNIDSSSVIIVNSVGAISEDGKSATVIGQGIWRVSIDGSISFTPENTFFDDPSPISYIVSDTSGLQSNQSTVTVDYNQSPSISFTKTQTIGGGGNIGDMITYRFTVENTGNVPLRDVYIVTDNVELTQRISLPVGGSDSTTFIYDHVISEEDMINLQVLNESNAYASSNTVQGLTDTVNDSTIVILNSTPVAYSDTASIVSTDVAIVNVIANDTDADGDMLTVLQSSVVATNGTATVEPDGVSIKYIPDNCFEGNAIVSYIAVDSTNHQSNISELSVSVIRDTMYSVGSVTIDNTDILVPEDQIGEYIASIITNADNVTIDNSTLSTATFSIVDNSTISILVNDNTYASNGVLTVTASNCTESITIDINVAIEFIDNFQSSFVVAESDTAMIQISNAWDMIANFEVTGADENNINKLIDDTSGNPVIVNTNNVLPVEEVVTFETINTRILENYNIDIEIKEFDNWNPDVVFSIDLLDSSGLSKERYEISKSEVRYYVDNVQISIETALTSKIVNIVWSNLSSIDGANVIMSTPRVSTEINGLMPEVYISSFEISYI